EAARSFTQALRADPKLGMAYLGLTDTFLGLQEVGTARGTLERAKALEKGMSEHEQMWLAIRESEVAMVENAGNGDGYGDYRRTVNAALKENPSDPWLWIQRGLADEPSPFTHG